MTGTWLVLFSSAVKVLQRRNCFSINENNPLNYSREIICFYSEIHMKPTNVCRMGKVQICSVECGSTYRYHSTLSCWNIFKTLPSISCPFVIPSHSVIRLSKTWAVVLLNKPKIHHVAWLHFGPPPYSLSCCFKSCSKSLYPLCSEYKYSVSYCLVKALFTVYGVRKWA
jgi:hypothetical protein